MRASPHLTFYRYKRHLDPRSGIVTRIRPIRDETVDYHVAVVDYRGGRASGRGRSRIEAIVSGLCEALERHSSTFRGTELRLVGDDEEKTRVESLTMMRTCFVPTSTCYLDHPEGRATPAGCAAGETIEEATLNGLLELIERDALETWLELPRPAIDLGSMKDPVVDDFICAYAMRGLSVWAVDVTDIFGVPTVAAVAEDGADRYLGSAAHFDGPTAVHAALSELHQRFTLGVKADAIGEDRGDRVDVSELPVANEAAPELGVRRLIATADRLGLEVLRLDLTRQDVGLPVVRTFISPRTS